MELLFVSVVALIAIFSMSVVAMKTIKIIVSRNIER